MKSCAHEGVLVNDDRPLANSHTNRTLDSLNNVDCPPGKALTANASTKMSRQ